MPKPPWKPTRGRTIGSLDNDGPRNDDAIALADVSRDPACKRCPFGRNHTDNACLWGDGPVPADGMVIYEQPDYWDVNHDRPLLGQVGSYFNIVFHDAELERSDLYITNAIKCKAASKDVDRKERAEGQKQCASYLSAEINAVRPKVILAMGESAFYYFTHKIGGVVAARGEAVQWLSPWLNADGTPYRPEVIYTISPKMAMTAPAYERPFALDMKKFSRHLKGIIEQPKTDTPEIHTAAELNAVFAELWEDANKTLTFDLETRGFVAHLPTFSKVWCAAFTRGRLNADKEMRAFTIPLEHPDSPFLRLDDTCELAVVRNVIRLIFQNKVSGHNLLFDLLHSHYLAERYGIDRTTLTTEREVIDEALDPDRATRPVWRATERQRRLDATKKPKVVPKKPTAKAEPKKSRKVKDTDADAPAPGRTVSTPRARRPRAEPARAGGEDPADSRSGVGLDDAAGSVGDRQPPDGAGCSGPGDRTGDCERQPSGSGALAGTAA